MTPEEILKIEKKIEKRRKLTKKYQQEKIEKYENNDVRNETLEQLIKTEQEITLRKNKTSLDYYYKNKERLDDKRKELYQQQKQQLSQQSRDYYYKNKELLDKKRKELNQQQKEQINKQARVLSICKKILKYELKNETTP